MAYIEPASGDDDVVLLDAAPSQLPRRSPGRKETFADPHPVERGHPRMEDAALSRVKSEGLSSAPSPVSVSELNGTGDAKSEADVVELLETTLPNSSKRTDPGGLKLPSSASDKSVPTPTPLLVTPASPATSASTAHSSLVYPPALDGDAGHLSGPESKAASTSTSAAPAGPPASQKPKSVRKQRSPSPELPPPPPPPVFRTIRLDIPLGGPDNYAVDITKLAKETGQRPPTPPPVKRDISDSEDDGDEDRLKKGIISAGKGKAGRKKNLASEYYDVNDPFIDDSELAVDERTYFAQTKQQGFYVSSGEVALLKDKTPKKPKTKRVVVPTIIPLAGSQSVNALNNKPVSASGDPFGPPPSSQLKPNGTISNGGSRDAPIALLSDNEDPKSSISGLKRKSSETSGIGKKKRKTVEVEMFHPDLQAALNELKDAISRESFEQKGKFPPSLKPILTKVAVKAIHCGEYDDNFFSLMPKLFIYNKFTMTKLIKRTVYPEHQKLLLARQDELLEELTKATAEGFPKAQEEYEKSLRQWEYRQERAKADGTATGITSAEGTPAPGSNTPSVNGVVLPQLPHERDATNDSSHGMDVDGPPLSQVGGDKDGAAGKHSSEHPPTKRYRLTERLRNIIWELVVLSNESCRIENEKHVLENSTVQVSEQGTRKVLYQKIVAAFPDGWMSSGQISREVSVMKKRFEAQQAEEST